LVGSGGRVDLVLKKRRTNVDDESRQTATIDNPLMSTELPIQLPIDALLTTLSQPILGELPRPTTANDLLPTSLTSLNEQHLEPGLDTSSEKTNPIQRPTYLRLPTPATFSTDDHHPTNIGSSHEPQRSPSSEKSASNLKFFDSNSRGTLSGSFNGASNNNGGLPVLVVDDDPLTRTLMKRILTRLGCQVSCAENGEVALEMILGQRISAGATPSSDASVNLGPILEQLSELKPFDPEGKFAVVFLDNQMPVMSGLKVASKLRELGRADFVVGVTGQCSLLAKQ
jgi:osomolarity two-component system sensor histidine kinase SLN1